MSKDKLDGYSTGDLTFKAALGGALSYSPIKPFVGRRLVEVMRHDVLTTRVRMSDYFFEEKNQCP